MGEINIVLGIGFGDEGKGKIVQKIVKEKRGVVVRTSGGPNCGHTVYYRKGESHVFSTYGSGTFEGRHTYIGEDTLVSPDMAYSEYLSLQRHSYSLSNNLPYLFVHPFCELITPYDVIAQQADSNTYGKTTGKGIATTKKRIQDGISFKSIMRNDSCYVKAKLDSIKRYYGLEEDMPSRSKDLFHRGLSLFEDLDTNLNTDNNYTFEGNQGFFLDEFFGIDEYNTWADCTVSSPLNFIKKYLSGERNINVHYVTRSFLTRHGQGILPNEGNTQFKLKESSFPEHNVLNMYQGPFRKAPMNLDLLRQAVRTNKQILSDYQITDYTSYLHINHTDLYDKDLNDFSALGVNNMRFYADPF